MEKISLYIADKKVDLDDNSFILFNYTMEDLNNPTIVKNSFSKQITLKGTPANNEVFGSLYRTDRKTIFGDLRSGIYYDPLRKTPFSIYNEQGEIIESGYVKVDSIGIEDGTPRYTITLFGGLGSFFYGLMYKADASKMNLADIRFQLVNGEYTRNAGNFGQVGGMTMMQDAWDYMKNPEGYDADSHDCQWCNIINFSPCYNGLPEQFSADKALVTRKSFGNMPVMYPKTGANSNLMVFTNKHTEWEMKELRWYLQRPIISIRSIFDAICDKENNGGWKVDIDNGVKECNLYKHAWMTLPLIPAAERQNPAAIPNLLKATKSPAEYIIAFAKILGLVFRFDSGNKHISIMQKSNFYKDNIIDLSERMDAKSSTITPALSEYRIYEFGAEAIGEWGKRYKEDFGRNYGNQKVNTGNEFNTEANIITKDIFFKEAVEVQEQNLLFISAFGRDEVVGSGIDLFRLPRYEGVNLQQWKMVDGVEQMEEVAITTPYDGYVYYDNQSYPLSDWLPKVQFHEEENKAVDGSEVLLLFNGVKPTPQWASWAKIYYRLTDDTEDMTLLNDGQPCWNFTDENSVKLSALPSFRRCCTYEIDGDEVISDTFEWGEPLARGTNGVFHDPHNPATIFNRFWKAYFSDRYDVDTKMMRCKVNLSGMQVGQELMRNFFWIDGAIWVLNKIENHSITTDDLTECEFIKVKDMSNYTMI